MKKIILLLFVNLLLQQAFSQIAQGIFTYENVYDDQLGTGKVVTVFSESKSMFRVESTNAQTKSALGAPTTKEQNVLIFDMDKLTETHLNAERKTAVTMPFLVTATEERMKAVKGELTIQNLGQEMVGNYHCTHFVLTNSNSKYKTIQKDVWITKDLGLGNFFYISPYLYYPKGSPPAQKMISAGADGVVVKWQIMDPVSKKPNICTLVSYQNKTLPATAFQVPAGYQTVQR
jgi:hypothetical protein